MPDRSAKYAIVPLLSTVGPLCATREDGARINMVVANLLNDGYSVKLDFRGVKLVTPSFYAAAIADLYCTFPDEVSSRVMVSELPAMELFRSH
jgi:uncharacterized protein DUF4325